MATCKRCGKRTMWTDASGYCEKCHDELYIARMKRLAGDDSPEAGNLYKWQGPFRQVSCRLCGSSWDIEPRTGYCKKCIEKLEEKAKREKEERSLEREFFRLAGTTFHAEAFESLAEESDDWHRTLEDVLKEGDEEIELARYWWRDMEALIVPEPDNPEDPEALAVAVRGERIGYIKREDQERARELLPRVAKVTAYMKGGPYKMAIWDDEFDIYRFIKNDAPYYANIEVVAKRLE